VVNVRLDGVRPAKAGADAEASGQALCGRMVRVRIIEAKNHSLLGEEVAPPW
jgi:hypothetical protein